MEDFLGSYSVILRLVVSLSPVCGEAFLVAPVSVFNILEEDETFCFTPLGLFFGRQSDA